MRLSLMQNEPIGALIKKIHRIANSKRMKMLIAWPSFLACARESSISSMLLR
jgi:hypothetical protein